MATKKKTTTKRKTKSQRMKEMEQAEAFRLEIILWVIIAISLLLFISNFRIGGAVGNAVSDVMFGIFGLLAYLFPVALLVGSFFMISNRDNGFAVMKLVCGVILLLALCFFLSLIVMPSQEVATPIAAFAQSKLNRNGGGILGGTLCYIMVPAFGKIGAYIIDIIIMIVCVALLTGKSAIKGMKHSGEKVMASAKESSEKHKEYKEYKAQEKDRKRMDKKVSGVAADLSVKDAQHPAKSEEISEIRPDFIQGQPEINGEKTVALTSGEQTTATVVQETPRVEEPRISGMVATGEEEPAKPQEPEKTKAPKPSKEELAERVNEVEQEISAAKQPEKEHVLPPISLLKAGSGKKAGATQSQLKTTGDNLVKTLATFGVNVQVKEISCGPAVTRFELQPELGTKVSRILNLADDIKLNLAATDIRIEAPVPGKSVVGIEVPNPENVTVAFRDLVESDGFKESKSNIVFGVGLDIAGEVKIADIAKMPHLLIAGATGSGKSVCINTIIMSILYKASPKDVKMIMIDPKVVELSVYNGIPHLLLPVVTDPKKASGALNWAVEEMTRRYELFAESGVRDIFGYNEKLKDVADGPDKPEKMYQIVIIVDELADLMMVASGDVEQSICRLAQLARACGIHLIIATQRPSVNVITGLIKANMPSRIAFAVTSGVDSRTILDMVGAEKLLGKGDMLFFPQGIPKPVRIQGAFVSDKEVTDVVAFLKQNNGAATYDENIQKSVESMATSSNSTVSISDGDTGGDGRDSFFMEAARIIVDKDKASIGMLQRYLKVGFNRAARIMDQLEEAGVVGPEEGTKPRKVLMSPEELEQFAEECI